MRFFCTNLILLAFMILILVGKLFSKVAYHQPCMASLYTIIQLTQAILLNIFKQNKNRPVGRHGILGVLI